MASGVFLLIMNGLKEGSEVERMVSQARVSITLDLVEKAQGIEGIVGIVVATNSPALASRLKPYPVKVELDPEGVAFHFGRRLRELVEKYEMEKVLYMGGGSAVLLRREDMARMVRALLDHQALLIANNFYSSDFVAFCPGQALRAIELPDTDNDLAWLLGERAGLPAYHLPHTAATQLDVDTPTDLLVLKLCPDVPPHTRRYLQGLDLDTSCLERAIAFFTDRQAEVVVAGRVSASVMAYLERETACRIRLFSEERGMKASGRQARGKVRSLLGFHLEMAGMEGFFATLAQLGNAAFLDSRLLLAHRRSWPPPADRFYSDLRQPQRIQDLFLRRFTEEAMKAPIPVVLGGHSLLSGGMYALVEAAWARTEGFSQPLSKPL